MLRSGFAPAEFANGIVFSLVKDKTCDLRSAENYRPITLVTVISKLSESIILNCYTDNCITEDLQFEFENGL